MLYAVQAFSNISEEEQERMRVCFNAQRVTFPAGACVMALAHGSGRTGILMRGRADLTCTDAEGHNSILESMQEGDIFGEAFTPCAPGLAYSVMAVKACEVMLIDYEHLIKRCPNACAHHSQLVSNVLQLTARKAQSLAEHVNVLSQRTIRQKLLAYFGICRARSGSGTFVLPMTLTALADYLSVDRSAMMREMKRMKEEGVLSFRGRSVELYTSAQ